MKRKLVVFLVVAGSAATLVLLLVAGGTYALNKTFDVHDTISDPRACQAAGDNNVPLAQAMKHFHMTLPPRAAHVVFNAEGNPLYGTMDLTLRFQTTATGLAVFLRQAWLPEPAPHTQLTNLFEVTRCGLAPPTRGRLTYSQDTPGTSPNGGSSSRSVAVDESDSAHPTVWVSATDMPPPQESTSATPGVSR